MRIISNTTDFSSQFLHGMLGWVSRQVRYPVAMIGDVRFTRTKLAFAGRAYGHDGRILIRIGPPSNFPLQRVHAGIVSELGDPLEALAFVTAHEIRHLQQGRAERPRSRQSRERPAEESATRVLDKFRDRRAHLLEQWKLAAANPRSG